MDSRGHVIVGPAVQEWFLFEIQLFVQLIRHDFCFIEWCTIIFFHQLNHDFCVKCDCVSNCPAILLCEV